MQDHPCQPAFYDTWTLVTYLVARTERVTLVPTVSSLPLRPPAVLAKSAASLDLLSGGRDELGLGAGAFREAIEAMGGPRRTRREAVDALTEAVEVVRAMWSGERSVRTTGTTTLSPACALVPSPGRAWASGSAPMGGERWRLPGLGPRDGPGDQEVGRSGSHTARSGGASSRGALRRHGIRLSGKADHVTDIRRVGMELPSLVRTRSLHEDVQDAIKDVWSLTWILPPNLTSRDDVVGPWRVGDRVGVSLTGMGGANVEHGIAPNWPERR
jgi:hypothetical protein